MNSTDFHHLVAAPTVSRTTFFTKLLAEPGPRPQAELPVDEVAAESSTGRPATSAASPQPQATGFPA